MVKQTKSFRLMGSTITVTENYEGEFESQRRFIDTNKHLFKYRPIIENPEKIHPILKFRSNVMNAIRHAGGTSMVFMMEKKLDKLDINKDLNQLHLPNSNALSRYLTVLEQQRSKHRGLDVIVIDPRAETYCLSLKMCQSSNNYMLIKEWAKLVRDNQLEKDDLVEIWCFRVGLRLRLAVNAERRVDLDLRSG